MSEIVKRATRAVMEKLEYQVDSKVCKMLVRTVIEAIREPTEAIIDKALIVNLKSSPYRACSTYLCDEEAREIWGMQIDEMLK